MPSSKQIALCAFAALLLLALPGCAGSPSTLAPASENAGMITNLFLILSLISIGVFVVVEFLLFFALVRFRRKPTDGMPKQIYGNHKLEIAWTAAPAIVLAVIFVLTWQTLSALAAVPTNSLKIAVTGHQWWWQVAYPDLGVLTANEIHMPVTQSTAVLLESQDVIHSFWVPELGGKLDLIPGHVNQMWIRPTQVGRYYGQCAEFCGTSHANMRLQVFVDPPAQFDAWVAAQKLPAAAPTTDLAKQGAQVIQTAGCQACHSINGVAAMVGKVGPDLTHVASRQQIASGLLDFNAANVRLWLSNPPAVKPGSRMPKLALTPEQLDALTAYLTALK